METCKAKRGFFALRDCGAPVARPCAVCARPMCSAHLSPASGFIRCLDCEARQELPNVPVQNYDDPVWPYRYRRSYYRRSRYSPLYNSDDYDPYYDDYDFRSFDRGMRRDPTYMTDSSPTSFGDS